MTDQSSIQTTNAGLMATFYGPRGKLTALREWLEQGLRVRSGQYTAFSHSLRSLDLIAAQDTSAIQVTIMADGRSAEEGWPSFCQRLSRILHHKEKVRRAGMPVAAIWGYTLVYAAVTEENRLSDVGKKEALGRLLAHARPLQGEPARPVSHVSKIKPLAHSAVAGGDLWLTHLPLKEEGFNAATIYIALAPAASQATLAQQVLLGANALLLMPDLIAHKGYRERRQYYREDESDLSDLKHRYEKAADTILDSMGQLLNPGHPFKIASQLDALTQEYSAFLPLVPRFKQLHISIQRQLYNFERWKPENEMQEILRLHHNYLDTTLADLELLVSKGEDTLQVSKNAIDFVQTRLDKRREKRQQRIETGLAIIGAAFAVAQILDRELISAFISPLTDIATEEYTLLLGGIQLIVTILFALVVGMILKRSRQ